MPTRPTDTIEQRRERLRRITTTPRRLDDELKRFWRLPQVAHNHSNTSGITPRILDRSAILRALSNPLSMYHFDLGSCPTSSDIASSISTAFKFAAPRFPRLGFYPILDFSSLKPPRSSDFKTGNFPLRHQSVSRLLIQLEILGQLFDGHNLVGHRSIALILQMRK